MATRHREPFSAPVQLESLLEVPCKLILIEDLIREKSALSSSESTTTGLEVCSAAANIEDDEENNRREGERLTGRKCLFDCCATPSRWRDTDCYSNSSQFRTAGITLPWQDSLAVIPVMQVEKRKVVDVSPDPIEAGTNEDTHDVEISSKISDEEKGEDEAPSDEAPLSLISHSKPQQSDNKNPNNNSDEDTNVSQVSPSDPEIGQDSAAPKNLQQTAENVSASSSSIPTVVAALESSTVAPTTVPSPAVLGKVTEKPTRYEDFIIAQCTNTSNNNGSKDALGDTDTASQGSNNSADDTLKLTFYNEGRKESTKEFRTAATDTGGTSSSSNDVRYFENQGLQMSRVIRELGGSNSSSGSVGSEGNARLLHQHPVGTEITERTNSSACNDDNTQDYSKNLDENVNISSSRASPVITQPQQGRLQSSIIQDLSCNNGVPNSNANISNMGSSSSSINTSSTNEQTRQWEGLQISRCQKDLSDLINNLEGENSNGSLINREIDSESSLATATTTAIRPLENDKGESENSLNRHLQSYLTSYRYVKPAESGNERISGGQEVEAGRSPVISPSQSRHSATSIISPVISPHTGSPGVVASPVRLPNVQRVSPSQQAVSLESWPERTIARIPTRPFIRRNASFEQQQEHQLMQPRPPYHPTTTTTNPQQPKLIPTVVPGMGATSVIAPLHSPPKRFKTANVPTTSPMLPHSHSLQQQQQGQGAAVLNRYSNQSSSATLAYQPNRSSNSDHHISHNISQQQQQQPFSSSNSGRISNIQQQYQAYSNVQQTYNNQRPSSVHRPTTASIVPTTVNQPSHQSVAQLYSQHQSQDQHQYHTKYPTNSNSQSQQQQQQQQLQFRHIQESLLIASTGAMGSSSEPVDKSYSERLRRYCEYYHRQELDVTKLHEYYKKYGFYPWDILTARDESIIRQRKNQEQQQQQHNQQQLQTMQTQHAEIREAHNTRYDSARQMNYDPGAVVQYHQQQLQRQFANRTVNQLVTSPTRAAPNFSASQPTAVPGSAQAAIASSGRVINASPPVASNQITPTTQNRYNNNNSQQIMHQHQAQQLHQRDYALQQQQRTNSRYYQTDQRDHQNYHRNELQQQVRTVERCGNVPPPTNFDIQSSPHYRSAYNQLAAAAAAAVSSVASAPVAVVQNQLRPNEARVASNSSSGKAYPARDERINLLNSQSGLGIRPIVMTVSDPVPAPPEAVPLNIHRQALEQAIKNNQVAASNSSVYHSNSNRDYNVNFRRDHQRQSLHTPPIIPQHVGSSSSSNNNNQMPAQVGQSYSILGRARNDEGNTGGVHPTTTKEPLRVAPSPTFPHQTSVIRRIQQQPDNPPTALASFGGASNRYTTERPGVSYRRVSEGTSADSNRGVAEMPVPSTAFLYQQQQQQQYQYKDGRNNIQSSTPQQQLHQSHYYHNMTSSNTAGATSPVITVRRNALPNESLQQGILRGPQKRRIIITDNNGINQNITERCPGVASSPVPLIAGEEEVVAANVFPSAIRSTLSEELPDDDDRMDSNGGGGGGAGWQYDHVVLLDKRIKTYMCKRCFETLKTEQQIRNHLFCKMLANHVQCHVCLQLVTSENYPTHLQIHGVRPPDNIQIEN